MRRLQAVLFDLDGTLVETAPEISDAVNDTLAELGLSGAGEDLVRRWIGHGTGELMIEAYAHAHGVSAESVRKSGEIEAVMPIFSRHYLAHCGRRSHPFPRVIEALEHLQGRGVRLGIVTNKEGRYVEPVVRAHDLGRFFDVVVCGDTLARKKPDPLPLQHALRHWGLDVGEALFIGDSNIDVATARAAGVEVWLVPYGYSRGNPVEEMGADRVIENFGALIAEVSEPQPSQRADGVARTGTH
jgi:phosphoglycolate phosphatase